MVEEFPGGAQLNGERAARLGKGLCREGELFPILVAGRFDDLNRSLRRLRTWEEQARSKDNRSKPEIQAEGDQWAPQNHRGKRHPEEQGADPEVLTKTFANTENGVRTEGQGDVGLRGLNFLRLHFQLHWQIDTLD
jgi:hypothetical protein